MIGSDRIGADRIGLESKRKRIKECLYHFAYILLVRLNLSSASAKKKKKKDHRINAPNPAHSSIVGEPLKVNIIMHVLRWRGNRKMAVEENRRGREKYVIETKPLRCDVRTRKIQNIPTAFKQSAANAI